MYVIKTALIYPNIEERAKVELVRLEKAVQEALRNKPNDECWTSAVQESATSRRNTILSAAAAAAGYVLTTNVTGNTSPTFSTNIWRENSIWGSRGVGVDNKSADEIFAELFSQKGWNDVLTAYLSW